MDVGEKRCCFGGVNSFENDFVGVQPERIAVECERDVVIASELQFFEGARISPRQGWPESDPSLSKNGSGRSYDHCPRGDHAFAYRQGDGSLTPIDEGHGAEEFYRHAERKLSDKSAYALPTQLCTAS